MSRPPDDAPPAGEPDGLDPSGARRPVAEIVEVEAVTAADPERLRHLDANRMLIVKRSLLSSALGGALPIPILDDYFAIRIRAGLLMKLAQSRNVNLSASAAEVMAEGRPGSTLRSATMTAATLVALKLAWRKLSTMLAAGRGAEEAAASYESALLFDHYCARIHVGSEISRNRAAALRRTIHETVAQGNKDALVSIFRDAGRLLGRSMLQAPRWATQKLGALAQRYVLTRGNPDIDLPQTAGDDFGEDAPWLDRVSQAVEARIASLGNDFLGRLVDRFEAAWTKAEATAEQADADDPAHENPGSGGGT